MSNKKRRARWVWVVSGPSGSGKTTLCEALLKDSCLKREVVKSVSYTTRGLRPGERAGRDYVPISEKDFLALDKSGALLESEKIFGFYYGTPKRAVLDAQKKEKDVLLCVDVKGARNIRRIFSHHTASVFILPPNLGALGARLKKRSTENKKDIEKRLRRVKIELSYMKDYDYVVVNDSFTDALNKLKAILTAKKCERTHALHSARKPH
jgi:guanylate kinase